MPSGASLQLRHLKRSTRQEEILEVIVLWLGLMSKIHMSDKRLDHML